MSAPRGDPVRTDKKSKGKSGAASRSAASSRGAPPAPDPLESNPQEASSALLLSPMEGGPKFQIGSQVSAQVSEDTSKPEFIIGTVKNVRQLREKFVYQVEWNNEKDRESYADALPEEYLEIADKSGLSFFFCAGLVC